MSDVNIQGLVTIKNGDNVIADSIPNHFVDHGMLGIMSMICCKTYTSISLPAYGWQMYLGRDIETPTTHDMTGLIDPIYDGLGVPSTWKGLFIYDGTSNGQWRVVYRAIWQEGTVDGTIGEAALFLTMPNVTGFKWTAQSTSLAMASRLSVADTDFGSHTIDNTKTLTIDWNINFNFGDQ